MSTPDPELVAGTEKVEVVVKFIGSKVVFSDRASFSLWTRKSPQLESLQDWVLGKLGHAQYGH